VPSAAAFGSPSTLFVMVQDQDLAGRDMLRADSESAFHLISVSHVTGLRRGLAW
jgi:hypothetical protein